MFTYNYWYILELIFVLYMHSFKIYWKGFCYTLKDLEWRIKVNKKKEKKTQIYMV